MPRKTKHIPIRNPDWTTTSINLPISMKNETIETARRLKRRRAQLWRMAWSYVQSVGWENIPVVD